MTWIWMAMWLAKQPAPEVFRPGPARVVTFNSFKSPPLETWLAFYGTNYTTTLLSVGPLGVKCLEDGVTIGEDDPRLPACVVRRLKESAKGLHGGSVDLRQRLHSLGYDTQLNAKEEK